jgi:hypothetical protein
MIEAPEDGAGIAPLEPVLSAAGAGRINPGG